MSELETYLKHRAEREGERADKYMARAEAAESEVARLRGQLEEARRVNKELAASLARTWLQLSNLAEGLETIPALTPPLAASEGPALRQISEEAAHMAGHTRVLRCGCCAVCGCGCGPSLCEHGVPMTGPDCERCAEELARRDGPAPNDAEVICPKCVHQFRAIPVQVQRLMLMAGFEPPFTEPPADGPARTQEQLSDRARYLAGWGYCAEACGEITEPCEHCTPAPAPPTAKEERLCPGEKCRHAPADDPAGGHCDPCCEEQPR